MSTARLQQTATLLANGDVLVVGGFGPPGPSQQSASLRPNEVYDPATNTWTPEASMATARYGHIATLSRQWRAPGGGRPQPVRVVELDALVRRAISAQLGFPTITATAPTASPVGKTVTIRGWLFG